MGLVGKPVGLGGFVTVRVESDDLDRFAIGSIFPGPDGSVLQVEDQQDADRGVNLRFKGFTSRERAESLRGQVLTIDPSQRRELADDEFWPDELVGMTVADETGEPLGVVDDVLEGAAQDRLVVVRSDRSSFEIPFVAELVPAVDRAARRVTVAPIPGLIE